MQIRNEYKINLINKVEQILKRLEEQKIKMIIEKLKMRERKVIAHEMAHKIVGGRYTGPVHYIYTRGPDGKYYITGGDVSIDVSEESNPEDTIRKMQIVRAAALAPADPSPQDIRVAQIATIKEIKARIELAQMKSSKNNKSTFHVIV